MLPFPHFALGILDIASCLIDKRAICRISVQVNIQAVPSHSTSVSFPFTTLCTPVTTINGVSYCCGSRHNSSSIVSTILGDICNSTNILLSRVPWHGTAPLDIVLQHKEQIVFQNPNTGTWQLSRDLRTHYHVSHKCVVSKYPNFNPSHDLKVSSAVRQRLDDCHFRIVTTAFGITL